MTESLMLINETDGECRIAIVENGVLQEMLIEHTASGQTKNNIYKGVVVQVQTSLQAAFIDYGDKKHGFLPANELNQFLFKGKKQRKHEPIQHKLKVGQEVLVQVTREASNHKGAALTTNISLPGRFMVLMPNSDKGGVSKRIDDAEERERLKAFLSGIESEEHSVIIRTAGLGRSLTELKKDYTTLKKTWNDIWSDFEEMTHTGLVLEESDVVTRTLRDYYTEEIKEVWVDNPETFQKALGFFKEVAPRNQKDLKLFVDDRSLFATYHIERQVEQLTAKQVKLNSGGSIVIDQTEALVAIDVNSGRSNQEGNIDSTALRTNLEAAEEIARQLRLRNLGGLIVIDFIDMENESYRKQVEDKLSDSMKKDKAQLRFNPISQFGLLELSRQRLSVGISSTVEETCPMCAGKGKIPSILASTNLIIRTIREIAAKGNLVRIEGELPLALVNFLLNDRRQSISDLEMEFDIDIVLKGDPEVLVFDERCLKSVFEDRKPGHQPRKERSKGEPNKKWAKKQQQKKETVDNTIQQVSKQERKPAKTEQQKQDVEPDQGAVSEEQVAPETGPSSQKTQSKQATDPVTPDMKPADEPHAENYGIHPSCLFTDVKELENEELTEVTTAFGNRLKGKIENAPHQMIDDKYLWKNANEKGPATQPVESDSPEALSDDEKQETAASETQKRSRRKRTSASRRRKTASKSAATTADTKAGVNKESSEINDESSAAASQKTEADSAPKDSAAVKPEPAKSQSSSRRKSRRKKQPEQESNANTAKSPENVEIDEGAAVKEEKKKAAPKRRTTKKSTAKKAEGAAGSSETGKQTEKKDDTASDEAKAAAPAKKSAAKKAAPRRKTAKPKTEKKPATKATDSK